MKTETATEKKQAYVQTAHETYVAETTKTYAELDREGYHSFGRHNWADGLTGDEWDTIEDAIAAGQEAAAQQLASERTVNGIS